MALPVLEAFNLVGGTALALHFGHRISVDLDLFSSSEFDRAKILKDLQKLGEINSLHPELLMLNIKGVKVDIIHYPYPPVFPIHNFEGIRLLAVEEIAAMKLSAIANRGAKKDFYDLVELLNHFSLKEIVGFFTQKFPSINPFYVIKSLTWFEDAEEEPDPISLQSISWVEIKNTIEHQVKNFL